MSGHSVSVVEVGAIRLHPNADALEITDVGGWQVVVRKGQFKTNGKAIYIEPDYVVPTVRSEFAFLARDGKDTHRLKAVKLRGELSYGLLIPLPAALMRAPVGANVMEELGITRYEPPVRNMKMYGIGDTQELPFNDHPRVQTPKFDLENLQRYPDLFVPGEAVYVTEKIDGTNARYMWHDGRMFVGSRNRWLKPGSDNLWTRILNSTPQIEDLCRNMPDVVLYGEIYGPVQKLTYGQKEPQFAAFAAYNAMLDKWEGTGLVLDGCRAFKVPTVPEFDIMPYDVTAFKLMTEQDSAVNWAPASHMREGIVITPVRERYNAKIGRVALKLISNRYWLDKNT